MPASSHCLFMKGMAGLPRFYGNPVGKGLGGYEFAHVEMSCTVNECH